MPSRFISQSGYKKQLDNQLEKLLDKQGPLSPTDFETMARLADKGADITMRDNEAVVQAAAHGQVFMVRLLHRYGADLSAQDDRALLCAAAYDCLDVLRYLHENGCDIRTNDDEAMRTAAQWGYEGIVGYLYDNGVPLSVLNDQDRTKWEKRLNVGGKKQDVDVDAPVEDHFVLAGALYAVTDRRFGSKDNARRDERKRRPARSPLVTA